MTTEELAKELGIDDLHDSLEQLYKAQEEIRKNNVNPTSLYFNLKGRNYKLSPIDGDAFVVIDDSDFDFICEKVDYLHKKRSSLSVIMPESMYSAIEDLKEKLDAICTDV